MNLKDARELLKLSQSGLDRRAGVPLGTVCDLELRRNQNPSHSIVVRIVHALRESGLAGITSEQLFPVAIESQSDSAVSPDPVTTCDLTKVP